ncbi:hypothetical protein SAMN04489867_2597 [Pedococcus dokdonensis]|uniref:DUF559 domain-containing protein n=1 Tax=Pedococcus dokdonensis TaxID=443156 RepID=A0A1H0T141_9MICO|nr:hypothetical protein SAMN04489867_2597 [Pedococcus dokdonensis]
MSRELLRAVGVDRRAIRHAIDTGRWVLHGNQTVALSHEPLSPQADLWRAFWEVGPRIAVVDGASALVAAGLTGFTTRMTQVSVPHGSDPGRVSGVEVHRVTSRPPEDVLRTGPPRTTPAVAAIRAAQWAVSDRQAALVLAMTAQQRLASGAQLVDAARRTPGRRRVAFILRIAQDVAAGAESLGELDFALLCRHRGLPEPTRQRVAKGPRGRVYLDVCWDDVGLVVEIDGAGHRAGLAVTDDNFRQNALTLAGRTVLRIDLIGLRLDPDAFLDQVCEAHARLAGRSAPLSSG